MTILDYPLVSFHALSVAYTNKKECLVLFRKGQVKEGDFVSLLEVFDDNYSVKRIERSDFQNPKFQKEHLFFQDRMLVQLLFNALPRLLDDSEHPIYSNTSGKLYYPFKSTSAKSKSFLEIHLLPNMVLELPLRTFRKYELQTEKDAKKKGKQRKPRHLVIIDPQGHIFPYTSDAKSKQIFEQRSYRHHHKNRDFVSFGSYHHFHSQTKCGILAQFLRDVETCLSDYLRITFEVQEDVHVFNFDAIRDEVEEYDGSDKAKDFLRTAFERPIRLSMHLPAFEQSTGQAYLECIQSELEHTFGIHSDISTDPSKEAYNIHLLHEKKWYRIQKQPDPYRDAHLPFSRMQCISMESIRAALAPEKTADTEDPQASLPQLLKKSLAELIVKRDLIQQRSSFVRPWDSEHRATHTWNFISFERTRLPDHQYFYYFFAMKLFPDGSFSIETFDDDTFLKNRTFLQARNMVEDFYMKPEDPRFSGIRISGEELEGLYFNDDDKNLHIIIHTKEFLMPNVLEIEHALLRANGNLPMERAKLKQWIEEFKATCGSVISEEDAARRFLNTPENPTFTLSEYRDYLQPAIPSSNADDKPVREKLPTTKLAKKFFQFLYERHDILVKPFKQEWLLQREGITGYLKCHYFPVTRHVVKNGKVLYDLPAVGYLCGKRYGFSKLKQSKAIHVRHILLPKIGAKIEDVSYREILPMLGYAFVRNDYTVLPYPFKYLREYMRRFEIENGLEYIETEEQNSALDDEIAEEPER